MLSTERIVNLVPVGLSFIIWALPDIHLGWKVCATLLAVIITLLLWGYQTEKQLKQKISEREDLIRRLSNENKNLKTYRDALSVQFDQKVSDETQYLNTLQRIDQLLMMANFVDQEDKLTLIRKVFNEETKAIRLGGYQYENREDHQ